MKKLLALLLALAMCFSLVACGGGTSSGKPSGGNTDEKKLDVDEVLIGMVAPLTGASTWLGAAQKAGVELAIKEINAAGGILGVPVRFVTRDDESDPTKSLNYVEELVYNEGINMMVGQSNSSCAAATINVLNEEKILSWHLATVASIVDPETLPYSFRLHASNSVQAAGLVNLAKEAGFESVVLLGDTTDLGIGGIEDMKKYAAEEGLAVSKEITFVAGDADLSPVANAIKDAGATCVLSFALGADCAKIISALDRIGYMDDVTIIGYTGSIVQAVTDLVGSVDLSNFYGVQTAEFCILPGEEDLVGQDVYEAIKKEYGAYTADGSGRTFHTGVALRSYEIIYMYKWLIEQTGTMDPDVLVKYLEEHSSEYPSKVNPHPYVYSADNHEGWNPKNIITVTATSAVDDGVKFHGDVYQAADIGGK